MGSQRDPWPAASVQPGRGWAGGLGVLSFPEAPQLSVSLAVISTDITVLVVTRAYFGSGFWPFDFLIVAIYAELGSTCFFCFTCSLGQHFRPLRAVSWWVQTSPPWWGEVWWLTAPRTGQAVSLRI